MSASQAIGMSPGLGEKLDGPKLSKGQKKAARKAKKAMLKGSLAKNPSKVGTPYSSPAVRAVGGGGAVSNRLSSFLAHSSEASSMELDYLRAIVDPEVFENDTAPGVPDMWTLIPTGTTVTRNAGVITSTAGGAFFLTLLPSPRQNMIVNTGTCDFGYQYSTDTAAQRSQIQLANMTSVYVGVRLVGMSVTLEANENITQISGRVAEAPCPPFAGAAAPTDVPTLAVLPLASMSTCNDIFTNGKLYTYWLPAAGTLEVDSTAAIDYSPLEFSNPTRIGNSSTTPTLRIAGNGLPASTAVLTITVISIWEYVTTNTVVSTSMKTVRSPVAGVLAQASASKKMREHANKKKNVQGGGVVFDAAKDVGKFLIDNFDEFKHLGTEAMKVAAHGAGYLAPLAMALL
jgi:hypothetical protein